MFHNLVKLSLVLSLVNAGPVFKNVRTQLSGGELQLEFLATSVCSQLETILEPGTSQAACVKNFLSASKDSKENPPEVTVRCRSERILRIQATPSYGWQLLVLVPVPNEEYQSLDYSLVNPNSNFSEMAVSAPSLKHMLFSTVLKKNGGLGLWQVQNISAWHGEQRNYDVKLQFLDNNSSDSWVDGVVTWNHTGDSDLCFEVSNTCDTSRSKTKMTWPENEQRVVIDELHLDDHCKVEVKGWYGTTTLSYDTPARSAYEQKNTPQKVTLPEVPEKISIVATEDGDAWSIKVGWAKPNVTPEWYDVVLRTNVERTLKLPAEATEAIFSNVAGEGFYNVSVIAYKNKFIAHNYARALFPARSQSQWQVSAWGAAALGLLALSLCWLKLRRRIFDRRKPKGQEAKPLDEGIETLETESCEDKWEIKCDRLLLHEVIGEGAFGVVRRGILAPTGKEVAVKMLKDFPSADEVRAFRVEMELMKSVGAHPHVVSLLGCCSGKRPLIVAQYCARGDLLSFLRCSWDVMVSKRNAKYYNNNIDTSDYRNDLFKCNIQRDHSRLVVNKMYDLQGICDSDITSLDLLSFCRQIAMGMEFLATNRLVHRDLAARNVLVTSDRTLKIADFGLSRDVYEENQYKQKGNGKMPVKWMAPESLTRRIYTSQSDVWSFGVVVWEVVTVGGAPYPEVPAARLPRLLRAGYRMPRPPNCSKLLYELMLSCWRAHPRERPTFAELHQRLDELLNSACADEYLCLELDDEAPPTPKAQRYFKMIMRGKRAWNRESYERPLKAVQGNHNHYTSPPVTLSKAPV